MRSNFFRSQSFMMGKQLQRRMRFWRQWTNGDCVIALRVFASIPRHPIPELRQTVSNWSQLVYDLEPKIGRQLLNLGCTHHVAEIMLGKVFSLHDISKSPNIEIFGHFKDYWASVRLLLAQKWMTKELQHWPLHGRTLSSILP